ncbi:hypothetical protein [Streptomyces sp. NPDC001401]|uniref:Rv1733c family protein n=1 Tax=Streptomyces sp. NPDC001401 TaxID=3364570 RepID=UPI00369C937D
MPGTQRTKVGLWRWRRNPLRRGSDLAEAWILLALTGALLAGVAAADGVQRVLDRQHVERHPVSASLVEDAAGVHATSTAYGDRVWATVRWRAPDGSARTGQARVPVDAPAGARVMVWTDERGALTSKPASRGEVAVQAAMVGSLAAVGAGGVVLAGARLARGCLDRRRMRQWDVEWERVDTRRGGKTG